MFAAFKNLTSVHVEGSMVDGDGVTAMNITLGPDTARGTMTVPIKKKPMTMELIRVGERAFVRSTDLWRYTQGNNAAKALGHRWALLHKLDNRVRAMSLNGFAQMLRSGRDGVTTAGPKTVNGRPAVLRKDNSGASLYVAANGEPVPLRMGEPGGRNWFTFTDHDAPLDVREPADFVDLRKPPADL